MVERKMRGITKAAMIAKLQKRPWKDALEEYVRLYNVWPHAMTGISPAEIMFGRSVRGTLPVRAGFMNAFDDESLRDKDAEQKSKRNEREDEKRLATEEIRFQTGDKVCIKQERKGKLEPIYKDLIYEIVEVGKGGNITMKDPETGKLICRNVKMLRRYHERQSEIVEENNTDEEIEKENESELLQRS